VIDDALRTERTHAVFHLDLVPVSRQLQAIDPAGKGWAPDHTSGQRVANLGTQVGVATAESRDRVGAVGERIGDVGTAAARLELFTEGRLTYVARLGGTEAEAVHN